MIIYQLSIAIIYKIVYNVTMKGSGYMSVLLNVAEAKENKSGVYAIINQRNGRKYIGSSLNLKSRAYNHKRGIERKNHSNAEIRKDAENGDNFIFKIIFLTDETICTKRSEIKSRTQLLEYQTIKNSMISGELLYNLETLEKVNGRLAAEQEELREILERKEEIEYMLKLSNEEILNIYKHNIYQKEEIKIFETEILKRMNK